MRGRGGPQCQEGVQGGWVPKGWVPKGTTDAMALWLYLPLFGTQLPQKAGPISVWLPSLSPEPFAEPGSPQALTSVGWWPVEVHSRLSKVTLTSFLTL